VYAFDLDYLTALRATVVRPQCTQDSFIRTESVGTVNSGTGGTMILGELPNGKWFLTGSSTLQAAQGCADTTARQVTS
jgi:hypothetical protein